MSFWENQKGSYAFRNANQNKTTIGPDRIT